MDLILASSSPRRKELLESLGILPSKIMHPDIDESPLKGEGVREYVKRIAVGKARVIHAQLPNSYVLAADTVVEMSRQILLKASDREEAQSMLTRLSGRRHRVYTGICVLSPEGKEASKIVLTRISFKRMSEQELNLYLDSGEWEGKAGAYSIQGSAARFVKNLNGSYTNVVGLPLYETDCLLKGIGFRG